VADRASRYDSRIVTLGPLVFFSTETSDAWMLDPEDQLAACLVRDGSGLPVSIQETDERFAIEWTHAYQIDDDLMTFVDRCGSAKTVCGYPTREIEQAIRGSSLEGRGRPGAR
jgi:hypothetical protein